VQPYSTPRDAPDQHPQTAIIPNLTKSARLKARIAPDCNIWRFRNIDSFKLRDSRIIQVNKLMPEQFLTSFAEIVENGQYYCDNLLIICRSMQVF